MTKVQELERAVASLPEREYGRFRRWFLEEDWKKWDRQIEGDSQAGRLDFLGAEALAAKKRRKLRAI
jgi:hypothetical protein